MCFLSCKTNIQNQFSSKHQENESPPMTPEPTGPQPGCSDQLRSSLVASCKGTLAEEPGWFMQQPPDLCPPQASPEGNSTSRKSNVLGLICMDPFSAHGSFGGRYPILNPITKGIQQPTNQGLMPGGCISCVQLLILREPLGSFPNPLTILVC